MVADRAHVAPWSLDDAPSWWVERVRLALVAETGAAREREVREARRRRSQSGPRR